MIDLVYIFHLLAGLKFLEEVPILKVFGYPADIYK